MDFFDTLKRRHDIRKFQKKEIKKRDLDKIIKSADLAPSAGNLQAYEIFIIRDTLKKNGLADAANEQDFVSEAPVILVFCANPKKSSWKYGSRGKGLYSVQDATIAASYAQLAATACGLSSCWIGGFDPKDVLKILKNPKDLLPVCILPIGYPDEKPVKRKRRLPTEIAHIVK